MPEPFSGITMYEFKKLAGAIRYLQLEACYPDGMEKCVHAVQLDVHKGRVRARFMVNLDAAIAHLMKRNNWPRDAAIEWFYTNIESAHPQQILWVSCETDNDSDGESNDK